MTRAVTNNSVVNDAADGDSLANVDCGDMLAVTDDADGGDIAGG